jgi:hypothetical protein
LSSNESLSIISYLRSLIQNLSITIFSSLFIHSNMLCLKLFRVCCVQQPYHILGNQLAGFRSLHTGRFIQFNFIFIIYLFIYVFLCCFLLVYVCLSIKQEKLTNICFQLIIKLLYSRTRLYLHLLILSIYLIKSCYNIMFIFINIFVII